MRRIKFIVITLLFLFTAGSVQAAPARPPVLHSAIPIVLYHHIDRKAGLWFVAPQRFEQEIAYLHANGYHTVSLADYADHVQTNIPFPAKSIVLTFDDGYIDNYLNAFPLLKRYGLTGTFFIVSAKVGTPGYMTWAQINEMRSAGMEIGAHTMTHPFLTKLRWPNAFLEIFGSRLQIWWNTGVMPSVFAYPYNDHNATVVKLAKLAGFHLAVIVNPHSDDKTADFFHVPRITVGNGEGVRMFAFVVGQG